MCVVCGCSGVVLCVCVCVLCGGAWSCWGVLWCCRVVVLSWCLVCCVLCCCRGGVVVLWCDTLKTAVCPSKTPPCVHLKTSPCMPAPGAHVSTHVRVVPVHTGTSLNVHTEASWMDIRWRGAGGVIVSSAYSKFAYIGISRASEVHQK